LEQPREAPSLLRFAGFILDLGARTLVRETGEAVALTRGEFALLRVFVTRPGRVLSRDALLDALANRRFEPFDRSIDVMVGKLRRKIELDSKQPRLIVTVPGEGYRFDGLAKSPLSAQGLTMAVPLSRNDALPREDALSDAPPERRAEQGNFRDTDRSDSFSTSICCKPRPDRCRRRQSIKRNRWPPNRAAWSCWLRP
jgi:DNA-binding winged helix-turn-helix (wHTH) protein